MYPTNYPIDNVISSFKAVADRCPTFGNIPKGGLPSRLLLNAVVVTSEVSEVNQRRMEVISMHRCQNYACEIVKYDLRIVYMGIELFLISYFVFPIQLLPFSILPHHQKPICYPKPQSTTHIYFPLPSYYSYPLRNSPPMLPSDSAPPQPIVSNCVYQARLL